jgi:O-antigen ligase
MVAAVAGIACGASVAYEQRLLSSHLSSIVLVGLLVCAYLAIVLSTKPELVFTFWIFAAPLFQDSAQTSAAGKAFARIFYILPPLLMVVMLLKRRSSGRIAHAGPIDVLPVLYIGYVILSGHLIAPQPLRLSKELHQIYVTIGIGIIGYYFAAFGPLTRRIAERFTGALLASASVTAVLAIVDGLTGWNPWNQTAWDKGGVENATGISRAVATIGPASLGTFLGIAIVFALAVLMWNGPPSLKKMSKFLIVLALPAVYLTYTRGPMIAIGAVALLMGIVSRGARWRSVFVIVVVGVAVIFLSGRIASTSVYQSRFSNGSNVSVRLVLQRASVTLAERRPITGWGYGSFDEVKNSANLQTSNPGALLSNTSHNSFLTLLVELGGVGLILLLIPWGLIYVRTVSAARRANEHQWFFVGVASALPVYIISASTYDTRFFSYLPALPWILLGLARRLAADEESRSRPSPSSTKPDDSKFVR